MTNRPFEKKIEEMKKKQEEYKAREKQYRARQSQAERKVRTKRLIEVGAVVESLVGQPVDKDKLPSLRVPFQLMKALEQILERPIQESDVPKLVAFLKSQEERGGWFTKAMGKE